MAEMELTDRPKDWTNILFLTLTPVIGVPVLAWYTYSTGFQWWMFGLFMVMYSLSGLAICAGYHRYFSHKSYECSPVIQVFYAIFGAFAALNSILKWSAGHRRHHSFPESEWDPYSITRGFWWAHILWVFHVDPDGNYIDNVRDLQKNPVVAWQHRWYKPILLIVGFGVPTLIGAYFGNAIAGLLWGGFLRIVMVHHSTFMINSLAHTLGTQEYDDESTARDNWVAALLTFGEGYHSFHHKFPADFRNGVRWYNWDPAKWFITAMKYIGLASNLRMTAAPTIERTRMEVAVKRLQARIDQAPHSRSAEVRERIIKARNAFTEAMALWGKQAEERAKGSAQWKEIRRSYRAALKEARREWRLLLTQLNSFSDMPSDAAA